MNTAVMMKKISRFSTKSSIGARSTPWLSSWRRWGWRRRRTSVDREVVGEQLGLALRSRLEVVDGIEAGDAHRQAGHRADHRVGHAARHRAGIGRSAQRIGSNTPRQALTVPV